MQSSDINARKMLKKSKSETNMKNSGGKASKNKENDAKFERICQFYATTHKLKTLLRSGWLQWKIDADRFESVAEHIYGTQMLAFAVISEFELDLDLSKVLMMLAFHELGETVIGDITILDKIPVEEKHRKELAVCHKILSPLKLGDLIFNLLKEIEEMKTKEAKFVKMVDKFECDFQIKFHEENGQTSLVNIGEEAKEILKNPKYANKKNLAELWIDYHKENSGLNELFKDFSDYLLKNDIFK